jgi:hypothetical protein
MRLRNGVVTPVEGSPEKLAEGQWNMDGWITVLTASFQQEDPVVADRRLASRHPEEPAPTMM